VDPRVVSALQTSAPPPVAPPLVRAPRETVIIEEHHHGPTWGYHDPFCDPYPRRRFRRFRRVQPGLSVGMHFD
jgi:hypothetical protein